MEMQERKKRARPAEQKMDKRFMALGVLGFMALALGFFFVGVTQIGPMLRHHLAPSPEIVQARETRTSAEHRRHSVPESQSPGHSGIEIQITERVHDEPIDELEVTEIGDVVEEDEDGLTITLDPVKTDEPAAAEPREDEQAAPPSYVYRVQAATFANKDNADRMLAELRAKGYKAEILSGHTGDRTLYRVQVGVYRTREDANELARDLTAQGYEPAIMAERRE